MEVHGKWMFSVMSYILWNFIGELNHLQERGLQTWIYSPLLKWCCTNVEKILNAYIWWGYKRSQFSGSFSPFCGLRGRWMIAQIMKKPYSIKRMVRRCEYSCFFSLPVIRLLRKVLWATPYWFLVFFTVYFVDHWQLKSVPIQPEFG